MLFVIENFLPDFCTLELCEQILCTWVRTRQQKYSINIGEQSNLLHNNRNLTN